MSFPEPAISSVNAPYWEGLKNGKLLFQRCAHCSNAWLPPREACPKCLAPEPKFEESKGNGHVVSWVVYHTAYDEAFKDRLPYDVTCVELDEGPRVLTNVVDSEAGRKLEIGSRVSLKIELEGELALARFQLAPANK